MLTSSIDPTTNHLGLVSFNSSFRALLILAQVFDVIFFIIGEEEHQLTARHLLQESLKHMQNGSYQ